MRVLKIAVAVVAAMVALLGGGTLWPLAAAQTSSIWRVSDPDLHLQQDATATTGAIWHLVFSRPDSTESDAYVWTPPGWTKEAGQSYPVLYLLHGSDGAADNWLQGADAANELDGMLDSGAMVPMVVVMPDANSWITEFDLPDTDTYVDQFVAGLMPVVTQEFNTPTDAQHRALGGLSMGAFHTLNIVARHPELFS